MVLSVLTCFSLLAAKCKEGEFRCDKGACISVEKICDERQDCDDGSDERKENCRKSNPHNIV